MALREGAKEAQPTLLEPIMKVEVVTPEDYMGDVVGDLNRRRGLVQGMEDGAEARSSRPRFPWRKCSAMSTDLRSATQGRAQYTMEFARYAEVPDSLLEAIRRRS